MSYEWILFDADETLFDFKMSESHALNQLLTSCSLDANDTEITGCYKRINEELWREFEQGRISSAELRVERFRRFGREQGLSDDAEELSRRYLGSLAEGAFILAGALDICLYLKEHGYKMAIITNGIKEVQFGRIGRSDLKDFFEAVIVSEDTGFQKPQAGIFEHAFRVIQEDRKDKMLMVGDSLTSDIQGGNNIGINTCWYNPNRLPNETGIVPTYEIHDLAEIKDILEMKG
ncbi:YjjG family noncanonical pyrimidine nucleotidase [Paenibacillus cellulositrophicus]|uniref:YjjG family noncanonical pyrimidine nucleotidase n=1 Tax=Paenibacillus cellulositrophicus TaxID=562959 RepID=UPI00203DD9D5|nr:YjjG family noncanonical pyrimidine nucleotidase [Paenibacillus cellulositrophicus]MCM2996291.1 YjjG family noncanonical pyrimidine nucleotidase [Paenibacillus cellulositrophicus]